MTETDDDLRSKNRLFVDADLTDGATVGLPHAQAHYLTNVLRARPGDRVSLFNGRDGEWLAEIDGFGKGWCSLALRSQVREQFSAPDLWLLFAPVKRNRIDLIAEKATELGVSVLWPVNTKRTNMGRVNTDRLTANAVEAAEQCERLTVPEVREPLALDKVLADWPEERTLYYMDETGSGAPAAQVFGAAGRSASPAAVLIGPEGGFDKSELDALAALPFSCPVGLGPRILRADTAAIAALTCWQALCGDWDRGPRQERSLSG